MEITVIRLSRPLLIKMETRTNSIYQTVYGFVIKENINNINLSYVDDYIGYLAGLHDLYNGGKLFTISYAFGRFPDWQDKKGNIHLKQDTWLKRVWKKCIKKLNLSYEAISLDMDKDEYNNYINEENLIVSEEFYYDIKRFKDDKHHVHAG